MGIKPLLNKNAMGEACLVDKYINEAYDDVKLVADNMELIVSIYNAIEEAGGSIVPEAPQDGQTYGRKDKVWVDLNISQYLTEAPVDGSQYVRKDATWQLIEDIAWGNIQGTLSDQTDLQSALDNKSDDGHGHDISDITDLQTKLDNKAGVNHTHSEYIEDAPADGKQYARKDNDWEEFVAGGGDVEEAPVDGNAYVRKDAGWELQQAPQLNAINFSSYSNLGLVDGEEMYRHIVIQDCTYPVDGNGSGAVMSVAATEAFHVQVAVDGGAVVADINWAIGETIGTFTISQSTTLNLGDQLVVTAVTGGLNITDVTVALVGYMSLPS